MAFLSQSTWDRYKDIIDEASDTFNKEIITWVNQTSNLQRYGEDDGSYISEQSIGLECLIQYNYFRTWPTTSQTPSGEIDKETMLCILNHNYLDSLGYINPNGNFIMDPEHDYFILDGIEYKPTGDTRVAQANDQALLHFVILEREPVKTSSSPR